VVKQLRQEKNFDWLIRHSQKVKDLTVIRILNYTKDVLT